MDLPLLPAQVSVNYFSFIRFNLNDPLFLGGFLRARPSPFQAAGPKRNTISHLPITLGAAKWQAAETPNNSTPAPKRADSEHTALNRIGHLEESVDEDKSDSGSELIESGDESKERITIGSRSENSETLSETESFSEMSISEKGGEEESESEKESGTETTGT